MRAEAAFPAMGSTAQVVVAGDPALIDRARRRIGALEGCWTRFAESELTRLNGRPGEWVAVSPDLRRLVVASVAAWRATGGRFDPTVHDAVVRHGYLRSVGRLEWGTVRLPEPAAPPVPAPGCAGIAVDHPRGRVRLPRGVRLDPGGIGKGLAADMVAEEVMAAGAAGCLVSVGGDLSVRGATEAGGPWTVGVEHPLDPRREVARLALTEGGVASSSRMRRRWRTAGGWADHILDPRTGTQAAPGPAGASVVAGAAWWAEALATALLVAGPTWREVVPPGAAALVVGADGRVEWTPELSEVVGDAG